MASDDDHEKLAKKHFLVLNFLRLGGIACVVIGLLVVGGSLPSVPIELAYVLIVIGLLDAFVMPQVLARKWSSGPRE